MKKKTRRKLNWLVLAVILTMAAISLTIVLMAQAQAQEESNDFQAFEKPQLLESFELLLYRSLRLSAENAGEWLICPKSREVVRDYNGGYRVVLRPSGSFFVLRDGKSVFSGLWLQWPQKLKEVRK